MWVWESGCLSSFLVPTCSCHHLGNVDVVANYHMARHCVACKVINPETQTGGCQNYGPFLGTLNVRCRAIIGIPKGTIILTTTQDAKIQTPKPKSLDTSRSRHGRSGLAPGGKLTQYLNVERFRVWGFALRVVLFFHVEQDCRVA